MVKNRHTLVRAGASALAMAVLVAFSGCQTNTGTVIDKKATQGAIAGVLVGAAAGAAIDDKHGRGALIGAAVGGLTGGLIGNYLDKQAQELDAIPDANVERREESLVVMFPGDVMFDVGSHALAPGSYSRLRHVADTLKRYPDTNVIVKGHTDSSGAESYNLRLSEERAETVRRYLIAEGVSSYRLSAVGFGEAMPIATNATPEGRQQNRRVELEVRPNDQLREQAREQERSDSQSGTDDRSGYDRRDYTDPGGDRRY
jgi:outer membrane protein OmpA-like peptidoglycan-associated protein